MFNRAYAVTFGVITLGTALATTWHHVLILSYPAWIARRWHVSGHDSMGGTNP